MTKPPHAVMASISAVLTANALLRVAGSASGTLVALYLVRLQASHIGHAGAATAGALGGIAFAAELLFSLPLGVLADALAPRAVMVGGAVLGAAAVQLFAMTRQPSVFYASRFLEGVSVAAVTPPLLAWLAERTQTNLRARARAMSFFELSLLAGLALGGVTATQSWQHFGLKAFSLTAAFYLLGACLLAAFAGGDVSLRTRSAADGLRLALQESSVRRLAPVWLCVNAVTGLWLGPTLAFLMTAPAPAAHAQYFDGLFANAPAQFGWVLLGYALLFGVGVSAWGFAMPSVGVRRTMVISLATMLPVCAGFYWWNHIPAAHSYYRLAVGCVTGLLILIESGFTPAALAWLAASLDGGLGKGGAMGIYSVLLSMGALLGSLLAGGLGSLLRFDGLLLGTVLLAIAALILMARVPKEERVQAATP